MIKSAYELCRKEYPILPDFDRMDKEFELSLIESDKFVLRAIKRKIAEKFEIVLHVFEHVLSPDTSSFTEIHECKALTNGEKKQVIEVIRKLMEHYRLLLESDLLSEDKADAEAIYKTFKVWLDQKNQVIPLIKKIREFWQKNVETREFLEYLG